METVVQEELPVKTVAHYVHTMAGAMAKIGAKADNAAVASCFVLIYLMTHQERLANDNDERLVPDALVFVQEGMAWLTLKDTQTGPTPVN